MLLLVLAGAWELYVDLGGVSPLILPAPHAIAVALYRDRSLLWSNFLVTAEEVLLGIVLAAVAALVLATAMHFSADRAQLGVPAADRLPDDPDPDARADPRSCGSGSAWRRS